MSLAPGGKCNTDARGCKFMQKAKNRIEHSTTDKSKGERKKKGKLHPGEEEEEEEERSDWQEKRL